MAVGQDALASVAVLDALHAVELRLECDELDRGAVHVRTLRDVLELHALLVADGMGLAAVSQIALWLSCSENRAGRLLTDGQGLVELPGALDAVECGLLTVEQASTVVTQLAVLDLSGRLAVWRRLQQRLIADNRVVRPPARLAETLRRWVIEHDEQAAAERRRKAAEGRRISYFRRDDGLVDLLLLGFTGPQAQAILQRIQDLSAPFGADDDRTADQRRFDATCDLLLGRYDTCGSGPGAGCGCLPGTPVPCGAQLPILVPLGAALGTTDEIAELAGHGPLEPDQLTALLLNAPQLRAVFIDDAGVPAAVGDKVRQPERGDPASVRQALLELSRMPPTRLHPRHPNDHPPDPSAQDPPGQRPPHDDPAEPPSTRGGSLRPPFLARPLGGAHPPDTPGRYRVPARLRRLINLRAPRCEFPGCGVRAVRCDAEHDQAHPDGPTCACNLGPLCRRHHQGKQLLWTKTRTEGSAVRWTSASGRSWLSPSQHQPPAAAVRPLPPLPTPSSWDELSPLQLEEELCHLDLLPPDDDPQQFELRASDVDPDDIDPYPHDHWNQPRDTTWTQDLHNPYLWSESPA